MLAFKGAIQALFLSGGSFSPCGVSRVMGVIQGVLR